MRQIAILAFERVYQLGIAATTDTLQIANRFIGNRVGHGPPVCDPAATEGAIAVRLLSRDGAPVAAASGEPVAVHGRAGPEAPVFDLVLVPPVEYADAQLFGRTLRAMRATAPFLRRQHAAGAVLAGCGTGVFALAEAGLLDRHQATIGRLLEKNFHRRYPAVRLRTASAITESRQLLCASALPAMLPLMQRVVQRFTSPMIALQTLRAMQLEDAGDELAPAADAAVALEQEVVARAQYWLQQNLARKATLGELADYVAVSERTLIRHFKRVLGVTPHAYLQNLRMETARRLLERTGLRIDKVAERVGYGNVAFFRRSFQLSAGTTPSAYRAARGR